MASKLREYKKNFTMQEKNIGETNPGSNEGKIFGNVLLDATTHSQTLKHC